MREIGVGLIGTGYMGKCHALAWTGVQAVFGDTPDVRPRRAVRGRPTISRDGAPTNSALRARPPTGARSSPIPRSTSSRSPPPTRCTREWRSPRWRPASMCGAKSRWRPSSPTPSAMAEAARRSGRVAILGYNYIQSPADPLYRAPARRGAIGAVNHLRIEMDEDYHGRPRAAAFLAQRGLAPAMARSTISRCIR